MAKFTAEQAPHLSAIHQLIYQWGDELDVQSGLTIRASDVLTDDCRYNVGGEWRAGLAAVEGFYLARMERLTAAGGAPVMRHIISNIRVQFTGENTASTGYLLLFFAATGTAPFDTCDPLAVADVKMDMRREADGEWRISMFDSGQIFRRV
jgi:SnoaL-like domain